MERMKIEIEKSEYDRLKSREEKLLAYYDWFVDKENDLVTVEDIVNENIELHNTIEDVYKEKRELAEENKKLNEKVRFLEECLDRKEKLNEEYRKQIDKYKSQYEHSMGFMEEDTLQELKDIGEI